MPERTLLHSNGRGQWASMPLAWIWGYSHGSDQTGHESKSRRQLLRAIEAPRKLRSGRMSPHLVCVGGEDHRLRVPFLTALRERGFRITAVSSDDGAAFLPHGIPHHRLGFDRFGSGGREWSAPRSIRRLMAELRPDIVQSFDTKPNLLTPLALRGQVPVIRTINGLGWTFSSLEPRALALRPVYCGLQGLASFWTAVTVFQNRDDQAFFERYRLVGQDKGRVIASSGIDVDAFAAARHRGPSAAAMREELGLQSAQIVIFVGRLTRQKESRPSSRRSPASSPKGPIRVSCWSAHENPRVRLPSTSRISTDTPLM
ncbi:glycosyltransferase [Mesorhizobium sp. ORM6]